MKHPVWDRVLILLCAVVLLGCAAVPVLLVAGQISLEAVSGWLSQIDLTRLAVKAALVGTAVVFILLFLLLVWVILPSRKKRSSNYAIQRNENGMVRISLKALESLVQKCLSEHAELKVVTSSLFSDEESIRVDVHVSLQADISMPLAISALQKQIKKYLEACSGVMVQEVRVFVDSTMPSSEAAVNSPYAIPASMLGLDTELLPETQTEEEKTEDVKSEEVPEEAPIAEEVNAPVEAETEEDAEAVVTEEEEKEQGEQA